jgi:hypothetical protein
MKLTRNHYPVRYKRESFFPADNNSYVVTNGGSHLKKVSENETRRQIHNMTPTTLQMLSMYHPIQ